MDININPIVSGTTQALRPAVTQTATTDPVPVTPNSAPPTQPTSVSNSSNAAASTPDVLAQYEEAAKQAYLSFKNSYPLGDKEFTIYKDASGQLITRYVSLKDGSVTYVPAPAFVKNLPPIDLPAQITFEA